MAFYLFIYFIFTAATHFTVNISSLLLQVSLSRWYKALDKLKTVLWQLENTFWSLCV